MSDREYPRSLAPVRAPLTRAMAENAVLALGPDAKETRALVDSGRVPPDVLAAMTLFLLAGQPRRAKATDPAASGARSGEGRGVAGSVWVREHFTVHRSVAVGEEIEVTGEIQCAYSRRGRRYSVTTSETRDASDVLLVSNCTTGLVRYRRDERLADSAAGVDEDAIPRPAPDPSSATKNSALESLRALEVGDLVRGARTLVGLEQMRARDGGQSRNPIHTDPEAARKAGLAAPIVGGSHVFAYLQEALMQAFGNEALHHGACFDLRWVSQVRAGKSTGSSLDPRSRSSPERRS